MPAAYRCLAAARSALVVHRSVLMTALSPLEVEVDIVSGPVPPHGTSFVRLTSGSGRGRGGGPFEHQLVALLGRRRWPVGIPPGAGLHEGEPRIGRPGGKVVGLEE